MASPGQMNVIIITGDASPYYASLQRVQAASNAAASSISQRFSTIGASMTNVGRSMTRNVTLPIVAAGAASVKLAVDFEDAFTKIAANTNMTGDEIKKLKGFVMDLSGETAKSPQELADALYFLASAGLDATQVQETLRASAKASAAGFGEVSDIAKLTSQALNAYAKEGLKASTVTDVLAAAIREGTAEPTEFASALGRILPTAQKAGIGFAEVTASLASLSNIGLDVNEGVTAMRGLLLALLSPTEQARDTLAELGLSADDVRSSLSEDGLLATMRMLEDQTGGNIDTLDKLIGNNRALAGLFGITGQEAEKVSKSFDNVTNSSGDLDKAFDKARKGPGFQFKQMMADLQKVGIELGQTLLPVIIDIVHAVSDAAKSFSELPKPLQEGIIKFGLFAAAAGPVLSILGRLATMTGALSGAGAVGAAGGAAGVAGLGGRLAAFAKTATAIAATLVLADKLKEGFDELNDASLEELTAEVNRLKEGLGQAGNVVVSEAHREEWTEWIAKHRELTLATFDTRDAQKAFLNVMKDATSVSAEQRVKVGAMIDGLHKLGGELDENTKAQVRNLLKVGDYNGAMKLLQREVDGATTKIERNRKGINDAAGATADHAQKVKALSSAVRAMPTHKSITITAPGLGAVIAGFNALASAISRVGSVVANVPSGPSRMVAGFAAPPSVSSPVMFRSSLQTLAPGAVASGVVETLAGMRMALVLDNGKQLDAHIEFVSQGSLARSVSNWMTN